MQATAQIAPKIETRPIEMSQLSELVWNASRSVCQVETLDSYGVAHEDAALQAFLNGNQLSEADLSSWRGWFGKVEAAVNRGVEVARVHLLPDTLNDYLRYEIGYAYRQWCLPSGEKVFTLQKSANPALSAMAFRDFYVIDDSRVLVPEYTSDTNSYIGLSEVTNAEGIRHFVKTKSALLNVGTPLTPDNS